MERLCTSTHMEGYLTLKVLTLKIAMYEGPSTKHIPEVEVDNWEVDSTLD